MSNAQDILALYDRRKSLPYAEFLRLESAWRADLYQLYFDLPLAEGRILGRSASELPEADRGLAEEILEALSCFVDGALADVHGLLLGRAGNFYPYLFRAADVSHARPLIDELNAHDKWSSTDHSINRALLYLAWMGGEEVERQFAAWRDAPPAWQSVPPDTYSHEAGWELTPGGSRHDLFFRTSYRLVEASQASHLDAVRIMRTLGDTCPDCNNHLHAMFDLDLTLPEMAFLGLDGERLCIMTCAVCTLVSTVYTDVDWRGGAAWDHVASPPRDTSGDAPIRFPDMRLGLGPARRSPYEALFDHGCFWPSQLGGHPMWVQHSAYPPCPGCQNAMTFVGQTNIGDLTGPLPKGVYYPTEGAIYAFLCPACHKAATRFQFS